MQKQPNGRDLIQLGAKPGPEFGKFLAQAQAEVQGGQSWEVVKVRLRNQIAEENAKIPVQVLLRNTPLQVTVAADPQSKEEESNVQTALEKIKEVSRCPKVTQATLMPDTCPTGGEFGSIPVGGAIATDNVIIPAAHSSDLFCSMYATFFAPQGNTNWQELLDSLANTTRFGPFLRRKGEELPHEVLQEIPWNNPFLKGLEEKAILGLGTQGDGNHFAYLGETPLNENFLDGLRATKTLDPEIQGLETILGKGNHHLPTLVTHHGSRNFGAIVYKRGLLAAEEQTNGPKGKLGKIPKNLCWLDLTTPEGQDYQTALHWVGRWTRANHQVIHRAFAQANALPALAAFGNEHNAVWSDPTQENRILHGKGATPAWKTQAGDPQIGIIPLNMASPILLTLGAGNPNYLGFSPHGAGRNRSRTETMAPYRDPITKEVLTEKVQKALEESTRDILVKWWSGTADLSETPFGYKDPHQIKAQIQDFGLAHVFAEVSPRACVMAGEILAPWKQGKKTKKN